MKSDWDFRISDLVKKPWWNWYSTPVVNFGEVRRAQLVKFTLFTSTLVPWDFSRSFMVCSDANERERAGCRKQWEATAPIQSQVKLQPWFLSLLWKTCLRQNCRLGSCTCSEGPAPGQNTLMMLIYIYLTIPHYGWLARWHKWRSCDIGEAKERIGEWVVT